MPGERDVRPHGVKPHGVKPGLIAAGRTGPVSSKAGNPATPAQPRVASGLGEAA